LSFLNSAVLQISLVRPDATSTITSLQLAAGTKQVIPSNGNRFVNVIRNLGSDGLTAGKVISKVDREALDSILPTWHQATATTVVLHYLFDERSPKHFYVYPPVHATTAVYVEVVYSENPDEMATTGATIPLADIYVNPMKDWALYLAYMIDTDSPGSKEQAMHHFKSFYQGLGQEMQMEGATAADHARRY
jgi:hypothetical protein